MNRQAPNPLIFSPPEIYDDNSTLFQCKIASQGQVSSAMAEGLAQAPRKIDY